MAPQPWNLGPPVMDFTSLANLGKTFTDGYDQARKRTLDEQKRLGLARAGEAFKSGDYAAAAGEAATLGDLSSAAGLAGLFQKQKQSDLVTSTLNSWNGAGGGSASGSPASAAPVAGPASLIQNESGGNWQAQNNAVGAGGAVGHFGRLQFGQARIQDAVNAGALPAGTTPQAFMASPDLQKQAEAWHFNDIDQKIRENGFDKLVGQSINGVPVTIDGLRAVAHLGGNGGMKKFVESGGRYNPADENGTRLSDYFARHGGAGAPTQVAQAPQPSQATQTTQVAPVAGDDPTKLRSDAAYYEQSNPEAARQLRARADAIDGGGARPAPIQVAQTAPQTGAPAPDAPNVRAPGSNDAAFYIPGTNTAVASVPSIASDPTVKLWQQRLTSQAAVQNDGVRAIAQRNLDIAIKDAERRYTEGKAPESVREWQWAQRNNMTTAKSPTEYAKELAAAKRDPDTDVTNLRKEVQQLPSYKNMAQAAPIYRSMLETAGRNTKASDLNLVYGLGKIMDPTSVVREGEMIMVTNSAGMSEKLLGAINALNGGAALTPETRQALMQESYSRMNTYKGQFDQDMQQYRGIVNRRGFNADDVIPNIGDFSPYEPPSKAAKGQPVPGNGQPSPSAAPAAPMLPKEYVDQYRRPDGSWPPLPSNDRRTATTLPVKIEPGMTPDMIRQKFAPGTKLILPDGSEGVVK